MSVALARGEGGIGVGRNMILFSPMPPHVHIDFVVSPHGCDRSVIDFWFWGAHRAQLRCPDDASADNMCKRGVPGGVLNLSSTTYPNHGCCGDLPLQGKIPTAELGIKPRTSWLEVRSSDRQATRPVEKMTIVYENLWSSLINYS
jgi:hypothetical protein